MRSCAPRNAAAVRSSLSTLASDLVIGQKSTVRRRNSGEWGCQEVLLAKLSMNGTQSPEPALLPVGFWRRYEDTHDDPFDTRPWPVSSLIDDRPFNITVGDSQVSEADRMDVVEYCSLGYIESYEFGYATCRLCGANGPALVGIDGHPHPPPLSTPARVCALPCTQHPISPHSRSPTHPDPPYI